MELSLCMIVRNEEVNLLQCLESVRTAVDEIVIVDTGSSDRTKEIARRFTHLVFDEPWRGDFAAARNASLARASKPFILWLDADDVIDPEELEKLLLLKEELNETVDAVMLPYHYAFAADGRPSLVFDRERIVRRAAGFAFSGVVHEAMAVSGHVIRRDVVVRHTGEHGASSNRRNLALYEAWIACGKTLSPRDQYYYARELKNAGMTRQAAQAFAAFLQEDGWIENRLDAYVQRGTCLEALGDWQAAKASYAQSLTECVRAEALCALGACAMAQADWQTAIFWYRAALLCELPQTAGFVSPEAYGYIPLMQLCVCYDRMGLTREAARMNEQALLLRPGDAAATANRAYFEKALGPSGTAQNREEASH